MAEKWVVGRIIGKAIEQRGWWIFRKNVYFVAFQIPDFKPETLAAEVSFAQHCVAKSGQSCRIKVRLKPSGWVATNEYTDYINAPQTQR